MPQPENLPFPSPPDTDHPVGTGGPPPSVADPESGCWQYQATSRGIIRRKFKETKSKDKVIEEQLTNFTARITAEYILVEAVPERREFEITATLNGESKTALIPATEFERMTWVITALGPDHIVHAGPTTKDHARAAIQYLSEGHPTVKVYAHTGWREHGGKWVFLHGNGAIESLPDAFPDHPGNQNILAIQELEMVTPVSPIVTEKDAIETIEVRLPPGLTGYGLPETPPRSEWKELVRKSLALLEKAIPKALLFPLLAAVFRIALDECDFSLNLVGPTGVGKTELAALMSQFFGAGLHSRNLPGTFLSTTNQLMETAHVLKNVMFVVDDFVPTGSQSDMDRAHRDADRLIRAQGNHVGRGRCSRDGTPQEGRAPRCLLLITGEVHQEGNSRQARIMTMTVEHPGIVSPENSGNLKTVQDAAKAGLFAGVMTAFLSSIAGIRNDVLDDMRERKAEQRNAFQQDGLHPRQVEMAAEFVAGWDVFLCFALDCNAIDERQQTTYWDDLHDMLRSHLGSEQQSRTDDTPGSRFLQLLSSAVATGHAHLASRSNDPPERDPKLWGWEEFSYVKDVTDKNGEKSEKEIKSLKPRGEQIGWVAYDDVFLDVDMSLAAAQKAAKASNLRPLGITQKTLGRTLFDEGLLTGADKDHRTKKIMILGVNKRVLHISRSAFLDHIDEEEDDLGSDEIPPEFPGLLPE